MIYFWKSQPKIKKKVDQLFRSSHYGEIRTILTLETDLAVFGSFLGSNSRVSLFIALITHYPPIKNRYL